MRWSTVSTSPGFFDAGQSGCPASVPTGGGGADAAGVDCCALALSVSPRSKQTNIRLQLRIMRSSPCLIKSTGPYAMRTGPDCARLSYLDQGGTTPLVRAYAIDCPRCSC